MFDLKPREWAAVIPLVAMMVWMGVYPQSFLPPVGKATARVLEQTQVNVPFRVEWRRPPGLRTPEVARAH
jgi:NADH-quinone oxidoreductase subunit M